MTFRVPSAVALLALALTACQAQQPPAQAEVPVDAAVATAVSEVRSAAIDPVTGKARDAGAAFMTASDTPALAVPSTTLGAVDPGAPRPTLDITVIATVPGSAESAN